MKSKLKFLLYISVISVQCNMCAALTVGKPVKLSSQHSAAVLNPASAGELNELLERFIINNRLNHTMLRPLLVELESGDSTRRTTIVEFLERLGLALAGPAADRPTVIRDPAIIKALLTQGFAKSDSASLGAERILRERCRPEDLRQFRSLIVNLLKQGNRNVVLLAAKAKIDEARPIIESTAVSPPPDFEIELRYLAIARAALGNKAEEDKFHAELLRATKDAPPAPAGFFYQEGQAKDGEAIARSLKYLGLIGTRRSLTTICSYLSSDYKTYITGESEQSVRVDAMNALRYNFPDEQALAYSWSKEHLLAAEDFCRTRFGAGSKKTELAN